MKIRLVKNKEKIKLICHNEVITSFNECTIDVVLRWINKNLKNVEVEVVRGQDGEIC